MRTIRTFLLRILVDSAAPQALRGSLQSADGKQEPQPFNDEAALLELLKSQIAAGLADNSERKDKKGELT